MSSWFKILRPTQWAKNLVVFAGIIFARHLNNTADLAKVVQAFFIFTLVASGNYIINDIFDVFEDRLHPRKARRPLAAGLISPSTASWIGSMLIIAGLVWAFAADRRLFLLIVAYSVAMMAYTLYLKHVVILDVLTLALGFVIRAAAGAAVINVEISSWLIICTILLSLFLAISKRRFELILLEDNAQAHRPALSDYSPVLLDQMIAVVTSATLVSYCLYTLSTETVAKFSTKNLVFTIPFVIYGIFRYLYIIYKKGLADAPERALYRDGPLLVDVVLWIIACMLMIYIRI